MSSAALDVRDQRRRVAHLERVVDLGRRVPVVQRRGDEPGLEAREVVDDQADPVRHQRRDPVARLRARSTGSRGRALVLASSSSRQVIASSRETIATSSGFAANPARSRFGHVRRRIQGAALEWHRSSSSVASTSVRSCAAPEIGGRSSGLKGPGGGRAHGGDRVHDPVRRGGVPAARRAGLPGLGAVDRDLQVRDGRS